jgi:hypothetical protein
MAEILVLLAHGPATVEPISQPEPITQNEEHIIVTQEIEDFLNYGFNSNASLEIDQDNSNKSENTEVEPGFVSVAKFLQKTMHIRLAKLRELMKSHPKKKIAGPKSASQKRLNAANKLAADAAKKIALDAVKAATAAKKVAKQIADDAKKVAADANRIAKQDAKQAATAAKQAAKAAEKVAKQIADAAKKIAADAEKVAIAAKNVAKKDAAAKKAVKNVSVVGTVNSNGLRRSNRLKSAADKETAKKVVDDVSNNVVLSGTIYMDGLRRSTRLNGLKGGSILDLTRVANLKNKNNSFSANAGNCHISCRVSQSSGSDL